MGQRLLLISMLGTSVAYTILARRIPMDAWTAEETINAQTLPTLYGVLLTLVLLVALVQLPGGSRADNRTAVVPGRGLRLGGLVGLVIVFIVLSGWLNLWLALGALLFAAAWWLGERRWLPTLALAVSIPLAGYLGIEVGLGVYLPD